MRRKNGRADFPAWPRTMRNCRHAFTLLELMIVITIVGIVAAMVVPKIANSDDSRVRAAARAIVADIGYAQNLAITSQRIHCVRLSTTGYSLASRTDANALATIIHPVNRSDFSVVFAANASLSRVSLSQIAIGTQTAIAFDSLGTPLAYNTTTNATTTLTSTANFRIVCGQRSLLVKVEPYTGEITVE